MKFILLIFCSAITTLLFAQADSSHYFKSFDSTRIYYEDKGSGYPVILVHGFINTSQNWKKTSVYKDLLAAGYRLIIIDLRGNGKSDKPHTSGAYANDAEAKDIISMVNLLNLKSYNVISYSRGSIITSRLLVLDKRINKAVIGGMGTDFTDPNWKRRRLFYHVLNGDTSVPELEPLLKRLAADTTLDRIALMMQQKEQPSTSISDLQKINQQVLVLCGKDDTDNGNAKALSQLFKYGSFKEVPGDHGFAVTTKEFGEAALSFFKESN